MPAPAPNRDVFINCPFDADYKTLFYAIVFTVIRSGFRARCALETADASENRFAKICAIIKDCQYGVHDISRTEVDGNPPLPRFNMPLELGCFSERRTTVDQHRGTSGASSSTVSATATSATFQISLGKTSNAAGTVSRN
jgi:hypothetical protein